MPVLQHFVVPEADDAVAFRLNGRRPVCIGHFSMLPAVDFDHHFGAVAGKISDVMADWNLKPEPLGGKVLFEQVLQSTLRICCISA